MKKTKNAMLVIAGGLLIMTVATVSCSKSSPAPTPAAPTIASGGIPASDTIGKTITITGTGFSSPTTVNFPGAPGTAATFVSATTITVTVPSGATTGSGSVTVTTSAGTSAAATVTIVAGAGTYTGPTSNSVASANLIGHWTFDVDSKDTGSATEAATISGVTFGGTGQIGGCATFTNGYLIYPIIPLIDRDTAMESYTISEWVKMPTATGSEGLRNLFGVFGNRYPDLWALASLELNNDGVTADTLALRADQVQVDGRGPTQATTSTNYAGNGGWTFITETYDGTGNNQTLEIYANGNVVDSTQLTDVLKTGTQSTFRVVPTGNSTVTTPVPANNVAIGTYAFSDFPVFDGGDGYGNFCPTAASRPWAQEGITGQIDDIRLFNTALTKGQVDSLYTIGSTGH